MNYLNLQYLKLKTFTEQDALDYCQINNLNPNDITVLYLYNNELTDITGIKLFKNLEKLYLNNNELINISVLKNLNKLKILILTNNKLTDISIVKYLKNLEILYLKNNEITDISIIMNFKNLKTLDITNLQLESDQIQYINSCKNLEKLYCLKGFKDMNIINQLNKNIKAIE